ncbi:hypothetical protein [Streptomyces sp. NPDC096033]|uniref:hypothetical protein n=1 Tax=Streptomyces sp. NPDC096033 TaxID=3366071 RepID=UPI0037FDCD51
MTMLVPHHLAAAPGAVREQVVHLAASALAGAARFAVPRLVVFARHRIRGTSAPACTDLPGSAAMTCTEAPTGPTAPCRAA